MDDDTLGSGAADASSHAQLCGDDERDGHSGRPHQRRTPILGEPTGMSVSLGAAALGGHESVEAEAIRAEGLDPDDPAIKRRSTLFAKQAKSWNWY